MRNRDYAIRRYGYPTVLHCERCGLILYEDDEYYRSGYGGYLCPTCRDEDVFNDIFEEDDE